MLPDVKLKAAKLPEGKTQIKLADGEGLYLLINKSGKYWRLKYRYGGKEKTLSIGVYPAVSAKRARKIKMEAKEMLLDGIDPNQAKKEAERTRRADEAGVTFEGVAREWIEKKSNVWAENTRNTNISRLERLAFPWLGKLKLTAIKPLDVLDILKRVENRGAHETANRLKVLCSQVFRYGVATGRVESDPTRDLSGALTPANVKHYPCIKEPRKAGDLMRAIQGFEGTFVVRCALQFAPYVFVRPKNIREAEWADFDLEAKQWSIPIDKMKVDNATKHIVPLSSQVIAILEEIKPLTGRGRYVFPSIRSASRTLSENTLNVALRRIGYSKEEMCAHGFRGMASTLLHELGFNTDIIERQLAHVEGNAVKAAYNHARHLPERIKMMQEWADYLDNLRDRTETIRQHASK